MHLSPPTCRLLTAAVAVLASSMASTAWAVVPVFGGPGGSDTAPSGMRNAEGDFINAVSNVGVAFGRAASFIQNASTGVHSYRWDTTGAALGRFAGLSNIVQPTTVYAMTQNGAAYGNATATSGDLHPVRYTPGSLNPIEMQTLALSTAGHGGATAYSVNSAYTSAGQATLFAGAADLGTRAVRWNVGGAITLLNPLNTDTNGATQSGAVRVNESGTVVGYANKYSLLGSTNLGTRALRWANGSIDAFELDTPFVRSDGFADVQVRDVNLANTTLGTVKKWAGSNSQGTRGVIWPSGGTAATVLDSLGTDVNGVTDCNPIAMNDAGTVVGYTSKYSANNVSLGYRAVRWNAGGTAITELGLLPGVDPAVVTVSNAYAINRLGTIAGDARSSATAQHATIWPTGGTAALDLNSLLPAKTGWTLIDALSISDTGFVCGEGIFDPDGTGPGVGFKQLFTTLVPQAGTYGLGDANFDTHVDFADLLVLAKHYGQASSGAIDAGDLDLNGTTDFGDLLALAKHYGTSPASPASLLSATGDAGFADDWALAQSLVPEPTAIAGVLLAASIGWRRRGR